MKYESPVLTVEELKCGDLVMISGFKVEAAGELENVSWSDVT